MLLVGSDIGGGVRPRRPATCLDPSPTARFIAFRDPRKRSHQPDEERPMASVAQQMPAGGAWELVMLSDGRLQPPPSSAAHSRRGFNPFQRNEYEPPTPTVT